MTQDFNNLKENDAISSINFNQINRANKAMLILAVESFDVF